MNYIRRISVVLELIIGGEEADSVVVVLLDGVLQPASAAALTIIAMPKTIRRRGGSLFIA